jgi:hypothetical protein
MFLLEDKTFYVYIYLDPRKPEKHKYEEYEFDYEPFYVGKGHNNRDKSYFKCLNDDTFKMRKIRNIIKQTNQQPIVIRIKTNLNEQQAFDFEIKMIKLIGRKDLHKGPLVNLSDGGEGSSNPSQYARENSRKLIIAVNRSPESVERSRKMMILRNKDSKFIEENKKRLKGKKKSKESVIKRLESYKKFIQNFGVSKATREKISKRLKGKKQSPQLIQKRRQSIRRRYRVIDINNDILFEGLGHKSIIEWIDKNPELEIKKDFLSSIYKYKFYKNKFKKIEVNKNENCSS